MQGVEYVPDSDGEVEDDGDLWSDSESVATLSTSVGVELEEEEEERREDETNANGEKAESNGVLAIDVAESHEEPKMAEEEHTVEEGRSLRQRKPEQKNPYTFDFLRHKAQFTKIGLRPVPMPRLLVRGEEEGGVADEAYQAPASPESVTAHAVMHKQQKSSPRPKHVRVRKVCARFIDPSIYLPKRSEPIQQTQQAVTINLDGGLANDELEETILHKKRRNPLQGVLPYSYNQLQMPPSSKKPSKAAGKNTMQQPHARGVATTKINHALRDQPLYNLVQQPPHPPLFVAPTNGPATPIVILSDSSAEEADLIDRMGRRAEERIDGVKHKLKNPLSRKRRRRHGAIQNSKPRKLMDSIQRYRREQNQSPPAFLKVAARTMQKPVGRVPVAKRLRRPQFRVPPAMILPSSSQIIFREKEKISRQPQSRLAAILLDLREQPFSFPPPKSKVTPLYKRRRRKQPKSSIRRKSVSFNLPLILPHSIDDVHDDHVNDSLNDDVVVVDDYALTEPIRTPRRVDPTFYSWTFGIPAFSKDTRTVSGVSANGLLSSAIGGEWPSPYKALDEDPDSVFFAIRRRFAELLDRIGSFNSFGELEVQLEQLMREVIGFVLCAYPVLADEKKMLFSYSLIAYFKGAKILEKCTSFTAEDVKLQLVSLSTAALIIVASMFSKSTFSNELVLAMADAISQNLDSILQVFGSMKPLDLSNVFQSDQTEHGAMNAKKFDALLAVFHVTKHVETLQLGFETFWSRIYQCFSISVDLNGEPSKIQETERDWYIMYNVTFVTSFDSEGKYHPHSANLPIPMLSSLCDRGISIAQSPAGFEMSLLEVYVKALLARCTTLINASKFDAPVRPIAVKWYEYFAKLKFGNFPSEQRLCNFLNYDKLMLNVNENTNFSAFQMFLCLIRAIIKNFQVNKEGLNHQLASLIGRITPQRTYVSTALLTLDDFETFQNHLGLLFCMFASCPPKLRPPLTTLRELLPKSTPNSRLRLISLQCWKQVSIVQISMNESLTESIQWFNTLTENGRNDYQAEYLKYRKRESESREKLKFRELNYFKRNLQPFKEFLLSALDCLDAVITFGGFDDLSVLEVLLTDVVTRDIFVNAAHLPEDVLLRSCDLLNRLSRHIKSSTNTTTRANSEKNESQDEFGDLSELRLLAQSEAENKNKHFYGKLDQHIMAPLFRLLTFIIDSQTIADEVVRQIVNCWVSVSSCLIRRDYRELEDFILDWRGKESWARIADSKVKSRWTSYVVLRFGESLSVDLNAKKELFVKQWLRTIVEVNYTYQASLTAMILENYKDYFLFQNMPFHDEGDVFQVSNLDLSSISKRRRLLSRLLKNIHDKASESSASKSVIDECRNYVLALLEASQHVYSHVDTPQDVSLITSMSQHLIGEILRYCPSFCSEENSSEIRWFMDSKNFPQPEERDQMLFTAQSLRSMEAMNINLTSTRSKVLAFVAVYLQEALVEGRTDKLVALFDKAICQFDDDVGDENRSMEFRSFIIRSIFSEFLRPIMSTSQFDRTNPGYLWSIPIASTVHYIFRSMWNNISTIDLLQQFCRDFTGILDILTSLAERIKSATIYDSAVQLSITAKLYDFALFVIHVNRCLSSNVPFAGKNDLAYAALTRPDVQFRDVSISKCDDFVAALSHAPLSLPIPHNTVEITLHNTAIAYFPFYISSHNELQDEWEWTRHGHKERFVVPFGASLKSLEQTLLQVESTFFDTLRPQHANIENIIL